MNPVKIIVLIVMTLGLPLSLEAQTQPICSQPRNPPIPGQVFIPYLVSQDVSGKNPCTQQEANTICPAICTSLGDNHWWSRGGQAASGSLRGYYCTQSDGLYFHGCNCNWCIMR